MRIRRTTIRIAGVRTYPKLAEQVRGSRPCLLQFDEPRRYESGDVLFHNNIRDRHKVALLLLVTPGLANSGLASCVLQHCVITTIDIEGSG